MNTETSDIGKSNPGSTIEMTETAVQQVKALLARERLSGYGLRIAVTGGGCSGFSYGLDFEKDQKPGDQVLLLGGLRLYIDETSLKHLRGTVIDYVSGLQGAGFKFTNPNATGTCGCGTSFSV
jgi:iron-sulfur cluster assembly protein